jgi:hypothetical protein
MLSEREKAYLQKLEEERPSGEFIVFCEKTHPFGPMLTYRIVCGDKTACYKTEHFASATGFLSAPDSSEETREEKEKAFAEVKAKLSPLASSFLQNLEEKNAKLEEEEKKKKKTKETKKVAALEFFLEIERLLTKFYNKKLENPHEFVCNIGSNIYTDAQTWYSDMVRVYTFTQSKKQKEAVRVKESRRRMFIEDKLTRDSELRKELYAVGGDFGQELINSVTGPAVTVKEMRRRLEEKLAAAQTEEEEETIMHAIAENESRASAPSASSAPSTPQTQPQSQPLQAIVSSETPLSSPVKRDSDAEMAARREKWKVEEAIALKAAVTNINGKLPEEDQIQLTEEEKKEEEDKKKEIAVIEAATKKLINKDFGPAKEKKETKGFYGGNQTALEYKIEEVKKLAKRRDMTPAERNEDDERERQRIIDMIP